MPAGERLVIIPWLQSVQAEEVKECVPIQTRKLSVYTPSRYRKHNVAVPVNRQNHTSLRVP